MSDVLRTPTLSSYAYLGCRDRGIAVGYHSLGVYHGMLEYVIMMWGTALAPGIPRIFSSTAPARPPA
jgi:hypothetical protein